MSDPHSTFVPDDFIRIDSHGGHVGRIYWHSQQQFTIQSWANDEDTSRRPRDSMTTELRGSCALIATVGDWWAWVMS